MSRGHLKLQPSYTTLTDVTPPALDTPAAVPLPGDLLVVPRLWGNGVVSPELAHWARRAGATVAALAWSRETRAMADCAADFVIALDEDQTVGPGAEWAEAIGRLLHGLVNSSSVRKT